MFLFALPLALPFSLSLSLSIYLFPRSFVFLSFHLVHMENMVHFYYVYFSHHIEYMCLCMQKSGNDKNNENVAERKKIVEIQQRR